MEGMDENLWTIPANSNLHQLHKITLLRTLIVYAKHYWSNRKQPCSLVHGLYSDMGEKARKCRKNKMMMMIVIIILLIVFYCYLTESSFFLGFVTLLSQLTKVGDVTKELFLSKIIIPDFCYLSTCVHIKWRTWVYFLG